MASVAGFFFQSLNKSLVQVLLQKLGTRFLKYVNADLEKAAVGGLMDHFCLENVTLNLSQINSDLAVHHVPLQLASGSIAKVEINLYLAHSQLHIILTGLHVLALPSAACFLSDAASRPAFHPSSGPPSRSATHAYAADTSSLPASAERADSVAREIYDNQVEKVRSHIRVCTHRLFQEAVKKYLERLQRLVRQLRLQLREKAAAGGSDEVLTAAIDRHVDESKRLQLYLQAIAQEEAEGQPFLQWVLRYMPNIKIRFDGIHVHYDDVRGTLSHPVRCGVKIARLLLQPQPGTWQFLWPDDEETAPKTGGRRPQVGKNTASGDASNVFLDFLEGERGDGSAPTAESPPSAAGGQTSASFSGSKDLTYAISIEGFGIYWEDACATVAATAAAAGTASARTPAPTPGTASPAFDSSSLVRSPQELADVLSSSLSSGASPGDASSSPPGPGRSPIPTRPLPVRRGGASASGASTVADEKAFADSAGCRTDESFFPPGGAEDVFFRRWLIRPVSLQAQLGLHNASAAQTVSSGGVGDGLAAPSASPGDASTASGSSPTGPGGGAASRQNLNLKLLGRIEGGLEVEIDEGMVMGVSVFLERLRHQARLRSVRLYRPNMRPRCSRRRQERERRGDGSGSDGEGPEPYGLRGSKDKNTCKLWWIYAFQYVKRVRRERPTRGLLAPAGEAPPRNYWGRMEERIAHMKRYMRIAKRYMLEQRMQRLLSSSRAAGASASGPPSSFPAETDVSPSALPFALTSPPASLLSLSCPFLGNVASSFSSAAAASSGLPYTTAEEHLVDFFAHFWAERQAQLRRQEARGGGSAGGSRFPASDEDSDASFVVGILARRPHWAVAQWHMLAAAELDAAEKALLKTRSVASQKEEQKAVAVLLAQLEQEQLRLVHAQQRRLLAAHLEPDGSRQNAAALAQVQLQESEQAQAVHRVQAKIQELLQPYREAVLDYFDTVPSFVRLAREAVSKLFDLRNLQEEGPDRDSTLKRQEAGEDYREAAQQLQRSPSWSLSRERMLCWAEFYRNYTTVFPLTDCVLVDVNELQQLAHQQQETVLSLAESTRLPVKRAERRAPARQPSEEGVAPSRAVPPVPALLQQVLEGSAFRVPSALRNLLLGVLVRRLSVRIAPRAAGLVPCSARLPLLQARLEEQQRSRTLQWIELECVDTAVRLQTYEELSLSACMRRCDILHVRGTRAPSRPGGTAGGCRERSGDERRVVAAGQLHAEARHVLLRCACAERNGQAETVTRTNSPWASPRSEGSSATLSSSVASVSPSLQVRCPLSVPETGVSGRREARRECRDIADALVHPENEGESWRESGGADVRVQRSLRAAESDSALGAIGHAGGTSRTVQLKHAFQRGVTSTQRLQQRISKKWIWFHAKLLTLPLLQTQSRLGVPLFFHCAFQGQHVQVAGTTQQLQFLYEDLWRLWTVFVYAALGCKREDGVRQGSIQSSGRLEFYSTLLAQYSAHNRHVARTRRGAKEDGKPTPMSTGAFSSSLKREGSPISLQFLVERIVACVQEPSSGAPPGSTVSASVLAPVASELAEPLAARAHASAEALDSVDSLPSEGSPADSRDASFSRTAPSPFSSISSARTSSRSSSRRGSGLPSCASPASEDTPQYFSIPSFPVLAEAPRTSEPKSGAASWAPTPRKPRLVGRTEQESLLRDWHTVASALPLVHVFCRVKFPSVEVSLLDEPNFVSLRAATDNGGAAQRPPPAGAELDVFAFSSAVAHYEDRRGKRPNVPDVNGALEPCIVSITSFGGKQQLTPIPQHRRLESYGSGPSRLEARLDAKTRSTATTFTFSLPSQTLFFSLGTGGQFRSGEDARGKSPDLAPRLLFALSPFLQASTSSVLAFLSSFSIVSALVREKLGLYQLFQQLLSPSAFEHAPDNLLALIQRQVLLPSAPSGFHPLASTSRGVASYHAGGSKSDCFVSLRSIPVRGGSDEASASLASSCVRLGAAGGFRPSAGSGRAREAAFEELGFLHAVREKSDEDGRLREDSAVSCSEAGKRDATLWLHLLESSLAPLPSFPSPCGLSGPRLVHDRCSSESEGEDACEREITPTGPRREHTSPRTKKCGVEGRRQRLGRERADRDEEKSSRLTCPVPQVRLDDDGGCPSEAFLSHSEAEPDSETQGDAREATEDDGIATPERGRLTSGELAGDDAQVRSVSAAPPGERDAYPEGDAQKGDTQEDASSRQASGDLPPFPLPQTARAAERPAEATERETRESSRASQKADEESRSSDKREEGAELQGCLASGTELQPDSSRPTGTCGPASSALSPRFREGTRGDAGAGAGSVSPAVEASSKAKDDQELATLSLSPPSAGAESRHELLSASQPGEDGRQTPPESICRARAEAHADQARSGSRDSSSCSEASVSSSSKRLSNVLLRVGRKQTPSQQPPSTPSSFSSSSSSSSSSSAFGSRRPSPFRAGVFRAESGEGQREGALDSSEVIRGIRGVKAGKKSHPFKLFNG
ncbi:conserved hypothetical protein [Neospora caninum Liverpool]|uniref:Uncharacterized protein n=1 Tax=Neospora caninum (strain Liverpool) TaxID=572307 RepID=F0V9U9_NEOCL|nr:conserved hypothetical protein [Neospora caninum Liverpool]CBZ50711.1 conserved hypothetical protein [Neospora caninum Liverpool]CEL65322.1 TPA: hypothetical protein BN1204_011780 [Neospora caninum Liverpool]|eukprot:XP_003880744.1 conserved hypothetical protein [Neospora caninum Liverpool]